jgi:predicted AAA+ superfamily ATPase
MPASIPSSLVEHWSAWDRFPGGRPFPRPEVGAILTSLKRQSLVVVRGCRGVGKTTLMKLAAARLVAGGMPRDQLQFIDLEDPVWAPLPGADDLDVWLSGQARKKVVLIKGVERFPGWADWARRERARQNLQVAVSLTGPTGGPPPAGIGTVDCHPLDLAAWMHVFIDKKVDKSGAKRALANYLKAGGLPVARKAEGRRQALLDLFFNSLMKDVILLNPVRHTKVLTAVAVDLLSRTGQPVSASSLKGRLTRSVDQARMFLSYLVGSGLIHLVKRLEESSRSSSQTARLVFATDTGLAHAVMGGDEAGPDPETSRVSHGLCFTTVFHKLQRTGLPVWAWRAKGRHGLVLGGADKPKLMIDMQTGHERELSLTPLAAAMDHWACESGLLLTTQVDESRVPSPAGPQSIEIRSLAPWLISEELTDGMDDKIDIKSTDKKVDSAGGDLPPHLL